MIKYLGTSLGLSIVFLSTIGAMLPKKEIIQHPIHESAEMLLDETTERILESWQLGNDKKVCDLVLHEKYRKATDLSEIPLCYGNTLLHYVMGNVGDETNDLQTLKWLFELGEDPNVRNHHGQTPLHVAIMQDQPLSVIKTYVEAEGVDIDMWDNAGLTPLHAAVLQQSFEVVQSLLINGATPNAATSYGITPLHEAAALNDSQIIHLLLSHKASLKAKDDRGNTPLHAAVRNNCFDAAIALVRAGADIHEPNKRGKTPLLLAQHFMSAQYVHALAQADAELSKS